MNSIEIFWFLAGITIIFIILSTDPKSSANSAQSNQLTMLFSRASEGQSFLRKFTWSIIALFLILTIILSYSS